MQDCILPSTKLEPIIKRLYNNRAPAVIELFNQVVYHFQYQYSRWIQPPQQQIYTHQHISFESWGWGPYAAVAANISILFAEVPNVKAAAKTNVMLIIIPIRFKRCFSKYRPRTDNAGSIEDSSVMMNFAVVFSPEYWITPSFALAFLCCRKLVELVAFQHFVLTLILRPMIWLYVVINQSTVLPVAASASDLSAPKTKYSSRSRAFQVILSEPRRKDCPSPDSRPFSQVCMKCSSALCGLLKEATWATSDRVLSTNHYQLRSFRVWGRHTVVLQGNINLEQ